jgi:DNA-binding NarL/FixJ family response regulator
MSFFSTLPSPGLRSFRRTRDQTTEPVDQIVVLTGASTENEGALVLMAGASGYCRRRSTRPLEKALKVVQRGELWVSRGLTYHLFGELGRPPTSSRAPPQLSRIVVWRL